MKEVTIQNEGRHYPKDRKEQVYYASGGFLVGMGSSAFQKNSELYDGVKASKTLVESASESDNMIAIEESVIAQDSSITYKEERSTNHDILNESEFQPNVKYIHPSKITIELDLTINNPENTTSNADDLAINDTAEEGNIVQDSKGSDFIDDESVLLETIDPDPQDYQDLDEIESSNMIPQYGVYDMNGDGFNDAMVIDSNADGYVDIICIDQDANLEPDTFLVDSNENGILDYLIIDPDEDGIDGTENYEEIEKQISIDQFEYLEEYDPVEIMENSPHEDSNFI